MTRPNLEGGTRETAHGLAAPTDRGVGRLRDAITGTAGHLRVRRAASLVVTWTSDRYRVQNFLTRQAFACGHVCLEILGGLEDWTEASSLVDRLPDEPLDRLAIDLGRLAQLGAIVVEGSEYAVVDQAYRSDWEWGEGAGLFHFGIKDVPYGSGPERSGWFADRVATQPSPPLYQTNESSASTRPLPGPDLTSGIFSTMHARRSRREFDAAAMSLDRLTQVLYAGLGITSFIDEGLFGILPLTMTPSGGARNPYEGYVLAANVEGLEPAIYHYSALEHSLGLVRDGRVPPPSRLVADLAWVDQSAAVIFLVANFARTAWKYPHPAAYRVVLIEAGHIAQNMLLAATALDVAATPVAAICDSVVESALVLDPLLQGVVHAVVLGRPRKS